MVEVRLADSDADRRTCLRLRWTVFVEEQHVPPSLEVDEHDSAGAVHALALLDKVPAGAGRFVMLEPGVAQIGRMAVVEDARGKGIGAALLRFLEAEARRRGAKRLTLNAQVSARRFYEKAGYRAQGGIFDDAGIPHVRMERSA
ncbi:MAG TPA: GNAT family N-acetyltransferase [Myxococcales bacterium]|jgi:predicted GNAT family N-acyltransferase|nr:GNAT family N-acetyltransferase [Myxococcales bacterium]